MTKLKDITHLIIDMDGVLYRGNRPLPGLKEFFAFLRNRPIPFILATNNSTRSPEQYVDKLFQMGVQISSLEVLTSGQVTAKVLAGEYPQGTRIHVSGMPALCKAIKEEDFILADEDVEIVVASMNHAFSYETLKHTSLLIQGGARFIATNMDPTFPSEDGLLPGTGSLIAALETASGIKPTVIGKPEPTMFRLAMSRMGAAPETTATIGDRLDTDILSGKRASLITICVLSGSSSRAEAEDFGPDFIFKDISDLLNTWKSL